MCEGTQARSTLLHQPSENPIQDPGVVWGAGAGGTEPGPTLQIETEEKSENQANKMKPFIKEKSNRLAVRKPGSGRDNKACDPELGT